MAYPIRGIVASALYLVLGLATRDFTIETIQETMDLGISEFQEAFKTFIFHGFGFDLNDIAPTIDYTS